MAAIESVYAREILDSRGNPTVEVVLDTDDPRYGGFGLSDDKVEHSTVPDPLYVKEKKEWLKLYVPARSAFVLRKKPARSLKAKKE